MGSWEITSSMWLNYILFGIVGALRHPGWEEGGFFHILIFCTALEKMLWTNQFYGMFCYWLYSQVCGTAVKICLLCGLLGALQSIIGIWDFRSVSLFRSGTHILIFCWYNPFSLVVNGNLAKVYKYFFHDWKFCF